MGYDFTISRNRDTKRDKNGVLRRSWYASVNLYVPHEKWVGKLREYKAFKVVKDETGKERWKPLHRGALVNRKEIDIINKYNSEIRGIYNFYRLADNVSVLNKFSFIMEGSLKKTFAAKYQSTVKKVSEERTKNGIFGVSYFNKAGKQRCEFCHGGFTKKDIPLLENVDLLQIISVMPILIALRQD